MRAGPDQELDDLLVLMRDRLAVMHNVAKYKWVNELPIEDPEREKTLLDELAKRGSEFGLAPVTTRAFFAAQIEAAKLVQRADFRRWKAEGSGPQGDAPDLATVLRPQIDRLNSELLAALSKAKAGGKSELRSRAEQVLAGDGIDAAVREVAMRPLAKSR